MQLAFYRQTKGVIGVIYTVRQASAPRETRHPWPYETALYAAM